MRFPLSHPYLNELVEHEPTASLALLFDLAESEGDGSGRYAARMLLGSWWNHRACGPLVPRDLWAFDQRHREAAMVVMLWYMDRNSLESTSFAARMRALAVSIADERETQQR